MNEKKCCLGIQCPVKKTCKRYTARLDGTYRESIPMSRCTNQKKYVQDKENINPDSKRK